MLTGYHALQILHVYLSLKMLTTCICDYNYITSFFWLGVFLLTKCVFSLSLNLQDVEKFCDTLGELYSNICKVSEYVHSKVY